MIAAPLCSAQVVTVFVTPTVTPVLAFSQIVLLPVTPPGDCALVWGKKQMETIAEPWRPYRSIACRYIWRYKDTVGKINSNL